VRDVHDPRPRGGECAHEPVQVRRLGQPERRRGLVQEQNLDVPVDQPAREIDELTLPLDVCRSSASGCTGLACGDHGRPTRTPPPSDGSRPRCGRRVRPERSRG
jgi:hypothetical protein